MTTQVDCALKLPEKNLHFNCLKRPVRKRAEESPGRTGKRREIK